MSRFLFVVPPFVGHVTTPVSLGGELTSRGHDVAWALHRDAVGRLLPSDARVYALDEADLPTVEDRPWLESVTYFWGEVMVRLAHGMLAGVEAALDDFGADLVVADAAALAGPFAARRRAIPWATIGRIALALAPTHQLPKVREWFVATMTDLQREVGLEPVEWPNRSPDLVLLPTTRALEGDLELPAQFRLVGAMTDHRPEGPPFPWELLREMPRVFVSLGTRDGPQRRRFFSELANALDGLDVQLVVAAPPELVPPHPNVVARGEVPQLAVLEHVDAVVCHAGHNTVVESLARALPLVVAPIAYDQPVVAQQVVDARAGVRTRYADVTADELREAIETVLSDPALRAGAERVQRSFEAAGGVVAAADALEELAARPRRAAVGVTS